MQGSPWFASDGVAAAALPIAGGDYAGIAQAQTDSVMRKKTISAAAFTARLIDVKTAFCSLAPCAREAHLIRFFLLHLALFSAQTAADDSGCLKPPDECLS